MICDRSVKPIITTDYRKFLRHHRHIAMASPYLPSGAGSPYAAHRVSQSFDPNVPPAPPPKPNSQEVSRQSTPVAGQSMLPPTPDGQRLYVSSTEGQQYREGVVSQDRVRIQSIPDPGDRWLPKLLEDKSYIAHISNATSKC